MDNEQALAVSRVDPFHLIWHYHLAWITHRGELHICKYVIKIMKFQ